MTSQRLLDGHQACQRCSQPVGWVGYVVGIVLCDGTSGPVVHPWARALRDSEDRCLGSNWRGCLDGPNIQDKTRLKEYWGDFFRSRKVQSRHWVRFWGGATCRVKARKEQPPPLQVTRPKESAQALFLPTLNSHLSKSPD